ncbi:MAG: carboxypeptidase-like regulatory domain-containing protein [Pyrinomonadaceae bacterium]
MRGVEGRAVDSSDVAVPNICVALFTEKGQRFVAQTVTDENGYFRFDKISKGNYRLVGRIEYDWLCPVNVRIRRVSSTSGSGKKKLILQMRPSGIDDCSDVEVRD